VCLDRRRPRHWQGEDLCSSRFRGNTSSDQLQIVEPDQWCQEVT
jgi:hypothetical protein